MRGQRRNFARVVSRSAAETVTHLGSSGRKDRSRGADVGAILVTENHDFPRLKNG